MAQNGRPRDAWRAASAGAAKPTRGPAAGGSGKMRWVVAAFVVAGLAGAMAGLFVYLQPDPEPVVLVLPITQYKHADWPANPLADADAKSVFEAFPGQSAPAFPDQEKARILGAIQQVVDESRTKSKGRPIVVYLNALGLARNGAPYILPGDADPDDDTTWLPLDDVLALLGKATVPRSLILDLRPVSSPRSVIAIEDLNDAIQAKLKGRIAEDKFWILAANTPTDGPTLIRPVRQSAFALALSQGIGGRADGWNTEKSTNGKVSFQEFAQYARQATLIATGDQLPALFGPVGDFPLVSVPHTGPKALPEKIDAEAYPEWLKGSWIERDLWTNDGLHRRAPRIVLHQGLVASRAEEAWCAGLDPASIQDRHGPTLKKLSEAAKAFPAPVPPKKSHARWSISPEAAAQESAATAVMRMYLTKIKSEDAIKKEELQMAFMAVRGALDAKAEISPEAIQAAILTAVWNLKSPTQDQLSRAALLLATVPTPNRFAESTLVSWIAALPPEQVREWEKAEAGTVLSLLLLSKATEQALAIEGRSLPWLQGELDRLDADRRTALVLLGNPDSGPADFKTAKKLADSTRVDYGKVRDAGARLKGCFAEIEEGRAVLADLAAVYPHNLVPSPAAVATQWAALVEQYQKIRVLSQPPTGAGFPKLDELAQATRSFDVQRTNLMALRIGPDDIDPKRLELALRWPWLRANEREALRQRHADAAQAAAKRILDRWPTAPQPEAPQKAVVSSAADDAKRDAKLRADFLAVADAKSRKALAAQYRAAEIPQRAEIGWAVHPDDVPAVPLDAGLANPEPAHRKQREIDFARWLGKRYALEAEALRNVKDKACRDAAEELDAVASAYRNWNP